MCGPTKQEQQIADQQQAYATTVQNNYTTLFGEQQGVYGKLNDIFTPIAEAGPSQTGMSAAELAARNTQAINVTGGNYANAARALGGQLAGRSTAAGETGVTQALKAGLASSAAGQLSSEENQITAENYALGRQNWGVATGGLAALNQSATGAGQSGTEANTAAFKQADEIAQQQAQADQAIAGGITSAVMGAATFGAGAMGGGGFSGGLSALTGA